MKKFVTLLLLNLFLFINIVAKTYYCSPTSGKIDNPGTRQLPLPSLEQIFISQFKILPGDTLFLMSGNHGNVDIKGINAQTIFILAAPDANPYINHLNIGKTGSATNWFIKGIKFSSNTSDFSELVNIYTKTMFITIKQCSFYTKDVHRNDIDLWKKNAKNGIILSGRRNKLLYNSFNNIASAINISGSNCRIEGNKITNFSNFAIVCSGSNNKFIANLIKNLVYTGFNAVAFKALGNANKISAGNILLNNVIVDYTNPNLANIAPLIGIAGFEGNYNKWIIENNLVVTDHWHGITFFNISNSAIINNTVIDPYLNTKYPNLEKDSKNKTFGPVRIWLTKDGVGNKSINNTVVNNLANDFLIEDSLADLSNNIKVVSSYSAMDKYFEQWDYLNFHLRDSAMAINAGNLKFAPKIDADGTKRPIGQTVNVGAYEYSYIQAGDMQIDIPAEKLDVELRNNGQKHDWNGQKSIRVGGVGTNFDGVMVIPFALPPLPQGYEIKSADFSVYLEKIDNSPMGTINLHGLLYRKSPIVQQSDYYQGDIMGDMNARPIQRDFLGKKKGGFIKTSKQGNLILKDYLSSIYQSGAQAGDYIFLRLSPESKDVKDYHRWVFSSANADNFEQRPVIHLTIGPFENQNSNVKTQKLCIVSPDILFDGTFNITLINYNSDKTEFQLLDENKKLMYSDFIKGTKYSSKDKKLATGRYYLKINDYIKAFNVW